MEGCKRRLAEIGSRMASVTAASRMPVWFLTHGGGPLPLLGDRRHADLIQHLEGLSKTLHSKPKAIVIVSGHWEEKVPTVNTSKRTTLLYDYYGFPKEAYSIKYDAPASPDVAARLLDLLKAAGLKVGREESRGLDHGVFVPLKLAFPGAEVPVVQLSLLSSLDPKAHIELGRAISPIRDEGVLIIGSGSSYHNMAGFNKEGGPANEESKGFDAWLQDSLAGDHTAEERTSRLEGWEAAPFARAAHPREEHLLPAHVALGGASGGRARVMHVGDFFGSQYSSYEWE